MTATLERPLQNYKTRGDEAIERVNRYLGENVDDRLRLEELDREFAFYTQRLGVSGLYLADATNNAVETFKLRGALNKMAKEQALGETAARLASQGNHLLGGVYAAHLLDMELDGYVPKGTAGKKIQKAHALQPDGSMFRLHIEGSTLEESLVVANQNNRGVFVHPFNDHDVIAGQGTIADDVLEKAAEANITIDHVAITVGGGGALTGLAQRFHELDPHVTVHGVEAQGSNSLSRSLEAGRHVEIATPNHRYGGAAVKKTGSLALKYYKELPNIQLWRVKDENVRYLVEEYIDDHMQRDLHHTPLEPTSLVAVAGLEKIVKQYPGESIAVVGTGRNDALDTVWK